MSDADTERYLRASGRTEDGRYRLDAAEAAWLLGVLTRLGRARLELLRGLQATLPREGDNVGVAELKETLTNLIIMQTRLADRESDLDERIATAVSAGEIDGLTVDESGLRSALQEIAEAADHVRSVAAD